MGAHNGGVECLDAVRLVARVLAVQAAQAALALVVQAALAALVEALAVVPARERACRLASRRPDLVAGTAKPVVSPQAVLAALAELGAEQTAKRLEGVRAVQAVQHKALCQVEEFPARGEDEGEDEGEGKGEGEAVLSASARGYCSEHFASGGSSRR